MAHSNDLREHVIQYVEEGGSNGAAARRFWVRPSSAVKLAKRWSESGRIAPDTRGRLRGDRSQRLIPAGRRSSLT